MIKDICFELVCFAAGLDLIYGLDARLLNRALFEASGIDDTIFGFIFSLVF